MLAPSEKEFEKSWDNIRKIIYNKLDDSNFQIDNYNNEYKYEQIIKDGKLLIIFNQYTFNSNRPKNEECFKDRVLFNVKIPYLRFNHDEYKDNYNLRIGTVGRIELRENEVIFIDLDFLEKQFDISLLDKLFNKYIEQNLNKNLIKIFEVQEEFSL